MTIVFLLRGLALGFAIAAPVGPIGVLCIRRTLVDGRLVGFITGLGAATADATYGAVAAFGVSAVTSALVGARLWIHLLGALFLIWLGLRTLLAQPTAKVDGATGESVGEASEAAAPAARGGLLAAWASTVALTLTNPATILSFAAVFAGLGLVGASYAAAGLTVVGVFLGSALWWLILSGGVNLLRARFDARAMRWVNRISGLLLLGFAAFALFSL